MTDRPKQEMPQVDPNDVSEEIKTYLAIHQHSVNNPLAVVLGNVQFLLLKSEKLDEKTISRLRKIEDGAMKLNVLNEQLTDLIRSKKPAESDDKSRDESRVQGQR